jgi:outer membrane protein
MTEGGVRFGLAILFTAVVAVPAAAQTPDSDWIYGANGEDIVLEVGGGILTRPDYEGADDYTLRPWPVVKFKYLHLPFGTFGGSEQALKFSPSFRIISERDDSDYSGLPGLGDVDTAVEVGGTVSYRVGMFRGLATLRKGFGGHDGWVGEGGLDMIFDPTPKLEVSFGPRVHFASDDYLDTYLGVTPAQSAASGLPVFNPDGGVKGVGAAAEAKYRLNRRWAVVGKAGYQRLIGDAADSPITDLGSENQFTANIGLTYRFGLDLFD